MNLQVIRWLVKNRQTLTNCMEIVKDFDPKSPLIDRWNVVDKVAREVIPLLSSEDLAEMGASWLDDYDEYTAMSCGSELMAMGFDWKLVIEALVPVIVAILQALMPAEEE